MPFNIGAFMETVAKNGLTATAAATGGAWLGTTVGDNITLGKDGSVFAVYLQSAAVANLDEGRLRKTNSQDWIHVRSGVDQTTIPQPLMHTNYVCRKNDILNCEIDNGNNAQYDTMLFLVGNPQNISQTAPSVPPAGSFWVSGTGTATAVAATWTNSAITWTHNFRPEKHYKILGITGHSATGYAFGLDLRGCTSTSWENYVPGTVLGDSVNCQVAYYGDFGEFVGSNPPNMWVLCSAGDTAQNISMLVV